MPFEEVDGYLVNIEVLGYKPGIGWQAQATCPFDGCDKTRLGTYGREREAIGVAKGSIKQHMRNCSKRPSKG